MAAQVVTPWILTTWNDWQYGRPRTFHLDAFVGHEPGRVPSHFIALNLSGQVKIIELPGGESAHAQIYESPRLIGPGSDLEPVILHLQPRSSPHHPDLLAQVQGTQILLHNTGDRFVICTPPGTSCP